MLGWAVDTSEARMYSRECKVMYIPRDTITRMSIESTLFVVLRTLRDLFPFVPSGRSGDDPVL